MKNNTNYDCVIIGASIAGLFAGGKLAEAGKNVCIVDRKKNIGLPVRCGEATGNRKELERFFPVDESWISRDLKGLVAHNNSATAFKKEIDDVGVILYRDKFEQYLAKRAKEFGATLLLVTNVIDLITKENRVTGVSCDNKKIIYGNLVIGADGCESKIGRLAGITNIIPLDEAFSSIQYCVKSDFCNDGYLHFFIGKEHIKDGYIWVFPKSANEISVGAGLYKGDNTKEKVKDILERFISKHIPNAQCSKLITGCAPLSLCPKSLYKNNVIVIGDAARQVNPLTAGGIMNTLEATDMAVDAILKLNNTTNTKNIITKHYSRKWAKTQRRQQKIFYLLKELLLDLTYHELDFTLKKMSQFFKGKINRNTPFNFPIILLLRIFFMLLPKFLKQSRYLFK